MYLPGHLQEDRGRNRSWHCRGGRADGHRSGEQPSVQQRSARRLPGLGWPAERRPELSRIADVYRGNRGDCSDHGNGTGQGGEVNAPKLSGGEGPVAIHVQTRQDGTTENAECANRGICNRASGVCACFDGFGSSNGKGRHSIAGTRGDCGYVLPVFMPSAQ